MEENIHNIQLSSRDDCNISTPVCHNVFFIITQTYWQHWIGSHHRRRQGTRQGAQCGAKTKGNYHVIYTVSQALVKELYTLTLTITFLHNIMQIGGKQKTIKTQKPPTRYTSSHRQ